jgi:hypothetical protein
VCPRRRVVLVNRDAIASRIQQVVIEVPVATGSFDKVQNPIRHCFVSAIEGRVNLHLGDTRHRWVGDVGERANRKRSLVIMLMTIEDHVDPVILEELGNGPHLVVADGGIASQR